MSDEHGKIIIKPDEIMNKHKTWHSGEKDAAVSAGKRREAIGTYREGCGINAKAFSQFRAGLKIKGEGDRKDWLRSMQLLLPVAEQEIFGNEPDMFPVEAGGDDADGVPADAPDDGGAAAEPEPVPEEAARDAGLAEEAAAFDNNVKAVEFGTPA